MVAIALVDARPQAASPRAGSRRSRGAVAMVVVGALAAVGAVGGVAAAAGRPSAGPKEVAALDPGITTSEGDVSVVTQVYEPGQSSGWHLHAGIHAVSVLSGTLTVYDDRCRAATFGPGRPYVGGRELHLASNETDVAVEMVVTYISPSRPDRSTRPASPPAACSPDAGGRPAPPPLTPSDER